MPSNAFSKVAAAVAGVAVAVQAAAAVVAAAVTDPQPTNLKRPHGT
jgi:hypothetical protein